MVTPLIIKIQTLTSFSANQLQNLNEKFQQILNEAAADSTNLTDSAKIKEKKAIDE